MTKSRKDLQELENESYRRLAKAVDPPSGKSWVDYATTHQHVGAKPCWQCIARKKALEEHEAMLKYISELELREL